MSHFSMSLTLMSSAVGLSRPVEVDLNALPYAADFSADKSIKRVGCHSASRSTHLQSDIHFMASLKTSPESVLVDLGVLNEADAPSAYDLAHQQSERTSPIYALHRGSPSHCHLPMCPKTKVRFLLVFPYSRFRSRR